MGTEAAAGKNPVSHVGKIYSVFTHQVAQKVAEEVPGVREVYIWMVSQIGKPINEPVTAAQVIVAKGADRKSTRLNSSHTVISYAVFCLKKKKKKNKNRTRATLNQKLE